jgi:hypothetical protein
MSAPTKREIIIEELISRLGDPSLGLLSVNEVLQMIDIQQANFPSFPIAQVVDEDEFCEFLPNRMVRATLSPTIRIFFDASITVLQAKEFIANMKLVFKDSSLSGADSAYLRQNSIIGSSGHKFVEIRFKEEIVYRYKNDTP